MKVYVLFGQRHCSYDGQYAPEALAVVDEWTEEDNPSYMRDELAKYREDASFANLRVIALEISQDRLSELLSPSAPAMEASIV